MRNKIEFSKHYPESLRWKNKVFLLKKWSYVRDALSYFIQEYNIKIGAELLGNKMRIIITPPIPIVTMPWQLYIPI